MTPTPGVAVSAFVIAGAGVVAGSWAGSAVAAMVVYGVACAWFPIAFCPCCGGSGIHRSASGKTARPCRFTLTLRPCGRTRRRAGRAVFDYFRGVGA